jgi:hypothetical protein
LCLAKIRSIIAPAKAVEPSRKTREHTAKTASSSFILKILIFKLFENKDLENALFAKPAPVKDFRGFGEKKF